MKEGAASTKPGRRFGWRRNWLKKRIYYNYPLKKNLTQDHILRKMFPWPFLMPPLPLLLMRECPYCISSHFREKHNLKWRFPTLLPDLFQNWHMISQSPKLKEIWKHVALWGSPWERLVARVGTFIIEIVKATLSRETKSPNRWLLTWKTRRAWILHPWQRKWDPSYIVNLRDKEDS